MNYIWKNGDKKNKDDKSGTRVILFFLEDLSIIMNICILCVSVCENSGVITRNVISLLVLSGVLIAMNIKVYKII